MSTSDSHWHSGFNLKYIEKDGIIYLLYSLGVSAEISCCKTSYSGSIECVISVAGSTPASRWNVM